MKTGGRGHRVPDRFNPRQGALSAEVLGGLRRGNDGRALDGGVDWEVSPDGNKRSEIHAMKEHEPQ